MAAPQGFAYELADQNWVEEGNANLSDLLDEENDVLALELQRAL